MADRYDVEAEVDALITPGYRSGTVYRTELLAALSRARGAALEEAGQMVRALWWAHAWSRSMTRWTHKRAWSRYTARWTHKEARHREEIAIARWIEARTRATVLRALASGEGNLPRLLNK